MAAATSWSVVGCSRETAFNSTAPETSKDQASSDGVSASEGDAGRLNLPYGTGGGDDDGGGLSDANGDPSQGGSGSNNVDGQSGSGGQGSFGTGSPSTAAADGAAADAALRLPQDTNALAISKPAQDLNALSCKQQVTLAAVSPNSSLDTSKPVRWLSSNRDVVRINDAGRVVVVGSGRVKLIAVGATTTGQEIQDHIEITVAPAFSGYKVSMPGAILPLAPAQHRLEQGVSIYEDGLAKGRIRVAHTENNIQLGSVTATTHSSDFHGFAFKDFSVPLLDVATCSWFVEYTIEFKNRFVADITRYTDQVMTVAFKAETARPNHGIRWSATLLPQSFKEGDPKDPLNLGSGAQGFSPASK
jgi:hypothetical protein